MGRTRTHTVAERCGPTIRSTSTLRKRRAGQRHAEQSQTLIRFMKLKALISAVIVAVAPIGSLARPGLTPQKETEAIVLEFQAVYADTFNRRDAVGRGALCTETATLRNEWGDVTQSRATAFWRAPNLRRRSLPGYWCARAANGNWQQPRSRGLRSRPSRARLPL